LSDVRVAAWEDRTAVAAPRRAWTEENAAGPVEDDDYQDRFDERLEREQHQRVTWLAFDGDERGFARVVLSLSPRSVPFYARGGFEPATSLMVREADPGS
jgi:hypothetical protein